ncbi:MAG: LLM class flavin-dependent oxidoreductase [Caldilineaceae bacterium]
MKFGFVMPPDDAETAVTYAVEAEQAGWDAFFLSDGMWCVDAWLCLTAAAMQTKSIRLGTLLTPLSIMRPWKVAAQAATLDQLSNGRAILSIGMGAVDVGFAEFGEETDLRTRAELVDEGLEIIHQLWHDNACAYQGKHYRVDTTALQVHMPHPVQQPRIPIWVVGAWLRPKSMRRVLRCDGVIPIMKPKGENSHPCTPNDIRALRAWLEEQHSSSIDIVVEGETPDDDPEKAQAIIQSWAEAGATWWIESIWDAPDTRLKRLHQGPLLP